MELFNGHCEGRSHNLHRVQKYEGNCIALRIVIDDVIIERREEELKMTVKEYLSKLLDENVEK